MEVERRRHPATPVSRQVGLNLAAIRRLAGAGSQAALAEKLRERTGLRLDPSAIAKIETGRRSVSVDELLALSVALDVSPLRLLLPTTRDNQSQAHVTADLAVPAGTFWRFCEQLEPWWEDGDPAEAVDDSARVLAWDRMRLGADELEADRRDAEKIVDASGGYAAVTDQLRELRARTSLLELLDDLGLALASRDERDQRRRAERARDRPLERQIRGLATEVERLAGLIGARSQDAAP